MTVVPAGDDGRVFVRRVPGDPANTRVRAGIESLLPDAVFLPGMFDKRTKHDDNGNETVTRTLNKMRLCRHVCEERRLAEDFAGFVPLLDMIEELWTATQPGQSVPAAAEAVQ
jgi:hypothetical protein